MDEFDIAEINDDGDWEFNPRRFVAMVIGAFIVAFALAALFIWAVLESAQNFN